MVNLAIFMGQSNMAGRGEYLDALCCIPGHGYEFRSVTEPNKLFDVTEPFGKNENNSAVNDSIGNGIDRRSGDMVSAFMESYYSVTGIPIVGVQCSRGGTSTEYWNDDIRKNEATSRLKRAKSYLENNGYKINNIFMVWAQGETDADNIFLGTQTIDGYKNGTLSVFKYMMEAGVMDIFIVQTGHYNGTEDKDYREHDKSYIDVNTAQKELAYENDNIHTVASFLEYQSSMKDKFHYYQNVYNEIGIKAGKRVAEILNGK